MVIGTYDASSNLVPSQVMVESSNELNLLYERVSDTVPGLMLMSSYPG